jgi:HAE1 family hydrophobic/amphiphilic exporter-1
MDQYDYIEASVADLTNNALIGSALAIVVAFLFLMAFRASLVTAISIPLSLLIGFLVMRFTSITINVLTLSAMIIAVGRVIDNSIVILEVVYRRMQHGEGFAAAAINGVREVVAPITSATAATVVIFIPLGFVGGIVGEMFIPFGLTITYALVGSLLIALTVVPALSGYLLRVKPQKADTSSWYLRAYSTTLGWCLRHRLATIAIAVLLFFGSFVLVPLIGTSFMPDMNTNFLTVEIEMPEESDITDLKDVVVRAEDVIGTYPDVLTFNSLAGAGSAGGGVAGMFGGGGGSAHYASINVTTAPGVDSEALAAELEAALQGITETGIVTAEAMNAMSGGMGTGLELNVRGESLDDIATAADGLIAELQDPAANGSQGGFRERMESMQRQALESLTELELNVAQVLPKLVIQPDPARMQAAGLPPEAMHQVQGEFFMMARGATVAQAMLDGVPRDIFIQGIASELTSEDAARNLLVGFPDAVPLGEIATAELGEQATQISRMDGKVSATITAGIAQQNVGAVNSAVQSRIDSLDLPTGVEIDMGGITEDMQDSFSKMFIAIGVAMVLAYAVLVLTFRSFRNPIIIMVSLPLASIGALLALFATGRPLGVTALMGILMLVGIVLTNAVVLIAVVEQMRRGGTDPYQAVLDGSRTRLRPILMTALTTMIAMLPLAFGVGEGVLMAAELATVVVGGLFSSTLLTLLVIPVIYSVAYRIRPIPVEPEQAPEA